VWCISPTAPSAPRDFTLSRIDGSSRSLSSSWSVPAFANGIIINYTISCNTTEAGTVTLMIGPSTLSTTLTGLQPYTEYTCTVSALTSAGVGNASDPQMARTDQGRESILKLFHPGRDEGMLDHLKLFLLQYQANHKMSTLKLMVQPPSMSPGKSQRS